MVEAVNEAPGEVARTRSVRNPRTPRRSRIAALWATVAALLLSLWVGVGIAGIADGQPHRGERRVRWQYPGATSVAFFYVVVAPTPDPLDIIDRIPVAPTRVGALYSTIVNVQLTGYLAVVAVDAAGNESPTSAWLPISTSEAVGQPGQPFIPKRIPD